MNYYFSIESFYGENYKIFSIVLNEHGSCYLMNTNRLSLEFILLILINVVIRRKF